MKITDFIDGKVTYDNYGQYFWINNSNEGQQMLAELRGWGKIQNMFKSKGKYDLDSAEKFQDELGEWVASAINEKLERETEQNLLNKPQVSKCEGVERRASLIAFIQEKVRNRDMNLFMNASELVDQMLKRNL